MTDLTQSEIEELKGMTALLKLVRPEQRGPNCQAVLDALLEAAPQLLAMAESSLTADAQFAERECVEKDARIAEMSRRIDELTSWHDDEKTWRVGAEQERDDAMQRILALEDDLETAGVTLGAVCVCAALAVGEKYAGSTDHAAVAAVVAVLGQRDAVAVAAKEYLMRSVPDPNVGADAEDTLRDILADLGAEERDSDDERGGNAKDNTGCDV